LPVTNVAVTANVFTPDQQTLPVTFTDDGVSPDALAGDGLYSALLGYTQSGIYEVSVQFDNSAGEGQFVATAFQPSTDANGDAVPLAPPVPAPAFLLTKSLQIAVGNVAADDHGDTPAAATPVVADNTPAAGKIDHAGDVDVFALTTLGGGEQTYVRVTDLALGMHPRLRVFAADGTTVLFDATFAPALNAYLFIHLSGAPAGTTVYAEVSDAQGTVGGLYNFSAGARLASDVHSGHVRYLPLVAR
jgi:hypothetical protein